MDHFPAASAAAVMSVSSLSSAMFTHCVYLSFSEMK